MKNTERTRAELFAMLLLRLSGVVICCSVIAIFVSRDLMNRVSVWLTLGHLPHNPLFEYLTRTLSGMYFAHGLVNLAVSLDVRRYRMFVALLGFTNIFLGAAFFRVDLNAPMPLFWTVAEGPPIFLFGLILLLLHRKIPGMCIGEIAETPVHQK